MQMDELQKSICLLTFSFRLYLYLARTQIYFLTIVCENDKERLQFGLETFIPSRPHPGSSKLGSWRGIQMQALLQRKEPLRMDQDGRWGLDC